MSREVITRGDDGGFACSGWSAAVCVGEGEARTEKQGTGCGFQTGECNAPGDSPEMERLQNQIHEPGKMHKVKRILLAQLPVHPREAGCHLTT